MVFYSVLGSSLDTAGADVPIAVRTTYYVLATFALCAAVMTAVGITRRFDLHPLPALAASVLALCPLVLLAAALTSLVNACRFGASFPLSGYHC
jgi:hypothetical protein